MDIFIKFVIIIKMKIDPKTINVPLTEKEQEDRLSLAKQLALEAYESIQGGPVSIYQYLDGKSIIWTQDVKNKKFFTITTQDITRHKVNGQVDNFSGSFYIPHPLKGNDPLIAAQFFPRERDENGDIKSWIYVDDYVYAVILNNTPPESNDPYVTRLQRKKNLLERAAVRKKEWAEAKEKALAKLS